MMNIIQVSKPATPVEVSRLPRLTSLRWYSALLVFAYHVKLTGFSWRPLNPSTFGYSGVAFFFVLSGFVLTWSARPGKSLRMFYFRRFARVYPAHLAVLLVLFAIAAALVTNPPYAKGSRAALLDLGLLQAWWLDGTMVGHWNAVSWSLSAEAFFYALFPVVLLLLRRASTLTGAVFVGGVLVAGLLARRFHR